MRRLALLVMLFELLSAGAGGAVGQTPPPAGAGGEKAASVAPLPPTGLVSVYNRPIVVFRAPAFGHSPQARARAVEQRISDLIGSGTAGKVSSRPTSEGTLILVDGQAVFLISPQDIDPISGEGMESVVAGVVKNLTLALDESREARSLRALLRAAGVAALVTAIFLLFLWGLLRAYRGIWKRLEGFERRRLGKVHIEGLTLLEIDQILFDSRWDAAVKDKVPAALRNQLGPAVSRRTYKVYRSLLSSPRWQRIYNAGARPQRRLWASTGAKDPLASDVLYIRALAAPFTVNTMPEGTLKALADHGDIPTLMRADGGNCEEVLTQFAAAGIDIHALARQLQTDAAESFVKSWNELMRVITSKGAALTEKG